MNETRTERARLWNLNNPERFKENQAAYRKRNKKRLDAIRVEKSKTPEFKAAATEARKKFIAANPWYDSYQAARARCLNPKNPRYANYGGRGIKFLLSLEDIKSIWMRDSASQQENPSIDRIDNDGPYSLGNCRFIELEDNSRRKRTCLLILPMIGQQR